MAGTGQLGEILSRIKSISENFQLGTDASAVGLSIGSSSIKLIELKKSGKAWKLLHFGIVQLPEDAVVNRDIVNQIAVVESIKSLTSQIKLKCKNVCTGISGTSTIIKRMTLDVPNMRELKDQVFWEAEQYLPFDVSEVVMDFHLLSRGKDNKTDVLLVAVKRSVLETYMASISGAALRPRVVDTDYFALQNVFEANYPVNAGESVAIVDIGASAMKIVIVHEGVPVYTKDASVGGRNLTAEIQKQLNLSYMDAEALKTSSTGDQMPREVGELVHIMAENFASEIKRAVDFYNASSTGAPVGQVLLAGGSSKLGELPQIIEETTRIPTQMVNPFNSISYDPSVFTSDYIAAIAPIAAVPIGLALRAGLR